MKKIIGVVVVLAFIVSAILGGMALGENKGYEEGYLNAQNEYEPELEKLIQQYEELVLKNSVSNPEFYYGEAYILSQEEMPNEMICVTWCVNYSEVQCFITYEIDYLDEDYPYLLTMYSNGTKETLDDEVVVIWKAIG